MADVQTVQSGSSRRGGSARRHGRIHDQSYYKNRCIACDELDLPSKLCRFYKTAKCHESCLSGIRSHDRVVDKEDPSYGAEVNRLFDEDLPAWQNRVKIKIHNIIFKTRKKDNVECSTRFCGCIR